MRWTASLSLIALLACGGKTDPSGTTAGGTVPSPGGTCPTWFAPALVDYDSFYIGSADITLDTSWIGTESTVMFDAVDQTVLCNFTMTADAVPYAGDIACEDENGNPCVFAFEVELIDGTQTDGSLSCDAVFGWAEGSGWGPFGYGYVEDFQVSGGASYGPQLMYLYGGVGYASSYWYMTYQTTVAWAPDAGTGTGPATGHLEYEWYAYSDAYEGEPVLPACAQ